MTDEDQTQPPLDDADLARVTEQVSILLQLDRTRHQVPTQVDMRALANIPAYLSSVFRDANALIGDLSPMQVYDAINRRVSDLQAQIYLLRLEMDNRLERDPAKIYEDPMVVSAYGERLRASTSAPRELHFEPSLIASGWHESESDGVSYWRWMRPGDGSLVCVPHLGKIDQEVEIRGFVLIPEQIDSLSITIEGTAATVEQLPDQPVAFVARATVSLAQVQSANYLPIEFRITDFRMPSSTDNRLLGARATTFRFTAAEGADVGTGA